MAIRNRLIAYLLPGAAIGLLWRSLCLLPLLALGSVALASPGIGNDTTPPPHDLNSLTWEALHFGTSIMGMSLKADMKISILPREEAKTRLIATPERCGIPPADPVLRLELSSSFINDKDIHTTLLINPADASALQRSRIELTEGDERYKAYRFTEEGVFILRRKPRHGEARRSFEHWSDIKESFIPYPARYHHRSVMSDTAALLYMASTASFRTPGDEKSFIAYFDDSFHVITIEYKGIESIRADFRAREDGAAARHIMSYRDALQFSIQAHPLGRPGEESTLQIAGLEPPVNLFIDQEMRIPLEMRGSLGFMGEVSLSLEKAGLRRN
ncbi:MAG TPA: hypothetical protein ENJ22_02175 [Gammaproteobacteria bacterium]|nr:hypothetical protein [Gammaproteobacteria bacterium]